MYKIILVAGIFSLILFSCDPDVGNSIILSEDIILQAELKGKQVELTWNRPYIKDFVIYSIQRGTPTSSLQQISNIDEVELTEFTDTNLPVENTIYYQVNVIGNGYISSNVVEVNRDLDIQDMHVDDAVIWEEEDRIFLVSWSSQYIRRYDYNLKEADMFRILSYSPEYMDIGDNGSGKELYIPGNEGLLEIYNASDLEIADTIFAGLEISSVVSSDKGFLVCSVRTGEPGESPIRSYNRVTGELIDSGGSFGYSRLRMLKEMNKVFSITRETYPPAAEIITFDNNGYIIEERSKQLSEDNFLDPVIFRPSPDGNYFITGGMGALYDSTLSLVRIFMEYDQYYYSDFCFLNSSIYVFSGCAYQKLIQKEALDLENFYYVFYETIGRPVFLFRDGNSIVSVSRTSPSHIWQDHETGIIIEKVNNLK